MMDPSRLLSTARGGLERELLRSALADVAPDEVRARVLQSVAEVLATSAALTVAGASAAGSNSATAASATAASGIAGSATTTAAMGSSVGGTLLGGLPWLHALGLGGVLVAGVSVGVALRHPAEQGSQRQQSSQRQEGAQRPEGESREGAPHGLKRTAAGVPAAGVESAPAAPASEPTSLPEARADRTTPGALASTRAHANGTEYLSEHNRAPRGNSERVKAAARADTGEQELPPDWLGAQLQLLGEARGYLESGKLELAAELLGSYEQQFPGGVVGPQIQGLRAELRQQRSGRGSVP